MLPPRTSGTVQDVRTRQATSLPASTSGRWAQRMLATCSLIYDSVYPTFYSTGCASAITRIHTTSAGTRAAGDRGADMNNSPICNLYADRRTAKICSSSSSSSEHINDIRRTKTGRPMHVVHNSNVCSLGGRPSAVASGIGDCYRFATVLRVLFKSSLNSRR